MKRGSPKTHEPVFIQKLESSGLTIEDAEVIVVLASLLHDIGMSIHRVDHEPVSYTHLTLPTN